MENRKLRSLRTLYNIPQRELAELQGVTINTYSTKERGITPFFQNEMIKIVKFFRHYDKTFNMDSIFYRSSYWNGNWGNREIEGKIMNVEILLEDLEGEEIKVLELIYRDNKRYRFIEHELSMTIGTITKNKNKNKILLKLKESR